MEEQFLEQLKEIRKSPRKMHASFLEKQGLLEKINKLVPNDFKIKEKIDIIIKGTYDKCYCGNFSKVGSKWCSLTCRNKDSEIRDSISKKNSENKISRSEKMKKTLIERYGVSAIQDIPEVKENTKKVKQKTYDKWISETFLKYNLDKNKLSDHEYLTDICESSCYSEISEKYFNCMPIMTIFRHFGRIGFDPNFGKNNTSKGEREIADFVKSLGFNIIQQDRKTIKPYEIDILIPEKSYGIEFNGLYYHNNDKFRHINKTIKAKETGIHLIQIFEDEWYNKKEILKSMIKTKLGISTKIFARKTILRKISGKESYSFIEQNHIQGFVGAESYYGLYYENELISVLSVGNGRYIKNSKEIIRFCSKLDTTVIGGFSKLLKEAKKEYGELYSYSDLRFFSGEIYSNIGKLIRITEPGYYWTHPSKGIRLSRYKTRKNKLFDILKEKYDPELSETENMIGAGFVKIWDCGNKLFLL